MNKLSKIQATRIQNFEEEDSFESETTREETKNFRASPRNSQQQPNISSSTKRKKFKHFFCALAIVTSTFLLMGIYSMYSPASYFMRGSSKKDKAKKIETSFVFKSPEVPAKYLAFNKYWDLLSSMITLHSCSHLEFKVTDSKKETWEMPEEFPFPFVKNRGGAICEPDKIELEYEYRLEPFSLRVKRRATKEVLFDMDESIFIFTEKYTEISTKIPTNNIYGLGERLYKFSLDPGIYTTFPQDEPLLIEDGTPGHNTYGEHTVLLIREKSGKFFVLFLKNANAKETTFKNNQLTFQLVGGVVDFHIFTGQTPEEAIQKYHEFIGGWTIPPFWALGYHQSKWGYKNIETLKEVLEGFNKHDIPLDSIWSDIDYMIGNTPFMLDSENFPPMEMRKMLREHDKKWVPIVDAGIGSKPGHMNVALSAARAAGVILKNKDGTVFNGNVWPGDSHFIDFFHPKAEEFWMDMLDNLDFQIPFNGIWLDMNEITNFCDGDCKFGTSEEYSKHLPFIPGKRETLERKTLRMDIPHYGNVSEFYVHSLFNLLEQSSTYKYLKKKNPLPFILSRGTVFGSGQFSAHWFGDTNADWVSLRYSVGSLLNFNIFGMPLIGCDICGFGTKTQPELCARWTQLGVFYTFSRNHHEIGDGNGHNRQEPWRFGDEKILQTIRLAIRLKYSILKYMYMLFISQGGKGSVVRPLFFEFLDDDIFFNEGTRFADEQFMIGSALMATPVLYPEIKEVNSYFPIGTWYHFNSGQKVKLEGNKRMYKGKSELGMEPLLYIRGGYIVQRENVEGIKSSRDFKNVYELVVALEDIEKEMTVRKANGVLMNLDNFDENETYETCIKQNCLVKVSCELNTPTNENEFKLALKFDWDMKNDLRFKIERITVYGSNIIKTLNEKSGIYSGLNHVGKVKFNFENDDKLSILFVPELIVKANEYTITL